jgi:copper resistance protein D
MIFELLQPEPSLWGAITVIFKALYYISSLGAAGLAMFALGFRKRLPRNEAQALDSWITGAVGTTMVVSIISGILRVHVMSVGDVTNMDVWATLMRSRLGDAFMIRQIGLILILVPLCVTLSFNQAVTGAGILLVLMSYVVMGHSTNYMPRQELAASIFIHMSAVAFWAGSLVPLARAAKRGDRDSAALVQAWSRAALVCVAVLASSGFIAAALLLRQPSSLLTSWYGNALIAKLFLFSITLGLAAWHKLHLTRDLLQGSRKAGLRLSRSIRFETVTMVLVFYAVAEMVSDHPPDMGHRIP